jgi:threonyl-tRNA synthetase
MENQQEMEQMTPEELAARKLEMKEFFEEAVPFLEAQHKYEKLLAEISEYKFKRFQYDMQHASAMYQMQHPEEQESEERYAAEKEPAKESKRSLKKN